MTNTQLDLDYVRMLGEDIRAKLFPTPNRFGQQPYPLPVKALCETPDGAMEVRFVVERTFQSVGNYPVEDIRASMIWIAVDDENWRVDLKFGQEPTEIGPEDPLWLVALLRAICGVL